MRAYRVSMVLAGVCVIAFGLHGLVNDPQIAEPADILVWALSAVVVHDGLWLPLACLGGALLARSTAPRFVLIAAASVTAVALPAVLREDADHGNPTLLPLSYQHHLLLLLGACAAVAGAAWTVERLRRRRSARGEDEVSSRRRPSRRSR
ncbi:hypothetical protein [Actinocorallia aurantiaca]|uniref:Integral membrane protein n=1 Tax=Actinocorallia aurantiaca TaxID=46204 RepID=A0ABP6G9A4_9ACTN